VLFLIPLPVLLIGLAILSRSLGATPQDWGTPVIVGLGVAVMLPITSLIIGTGVLGSEIDDGTIAHILAKPLPRAEIIVSKLVVAVAVTAVTAGIPLFVTGMVAGSTQLAVGLLLGACVGATAYCSLFVLLSLLTRLPVVIGLIYTLVWEGLAGNLINGTKVLSVQQYVVSIANAVASSDILSASVSLVVALVMSALVTVGAALFAIDRLRSFSIVGETG
jgi:ABC-2 type transport system permease protein